VCLVTVRSATGAASSADKHSCTITADEVQERRLVLSKCFTPIAVFDLKASRRFTRLTDVDEWADEAPPRLPGDIELWQLLRAATLPSPVVEDLRDEAVANSLVFMVLDAVSSHRTTTSVVYYLVTSVQVVTAVVVQ
jgi:hypothetical protein